MSKEEKEMQEALEGLRKAAAEGVNIRLDMIRRKALYPDLETTQKRTHEIALKHAAIPVFEADQEIEHLLYHIDMLKKELEKERAK